MKGLYYLLIFLCIFQDLPLANYVGDYGRSVVGIFSVAVLFFLIIKRKKIKLNKTTKILIGLLIFLIVYNSIVLAFYIFSGKEMIYLGEDISSKAIKIFMYYFTNVIYFVSLYQIGKDYDEETLLKPFYYTFWALLIIMILEYIQLPSAFSFLHATRPDAYNRIRLLTNESSSTTTMIIVFFTFALQYAKKYKRPINIFGVLIGLLAFIYTTTSKSLFMVLGISVLVLVLFNGKIKLRYKFLISLVGFFSLVFLSNSVLRYFNLAYESSTTLYTRGYTFIISLLISIKYPLGTSNVLYLKVFTSDLKQYLPLATRLINNFNAQELMYILGTGTDKNISAYSGILQYGMYWGIFGNILFLNGIWSGVKNAIKQNPVLFFGFIALLLSAMFSISLDNKFEIWAFIFVLMIYSQRNRSEIE